MFEEEKKPCNNRKAQYKTEEVEVDAQCYAAREFSVEIVRATRVSSRRFLRELDEASGGNNLHYILQCLRVPASVTRV